MLGLGETKEEVFELMNDLLSVNCKSRKHYLVKSYIHPNIFDEFKEIALLKGFQKVVSGPFERSSYHADISFNS